jgi:hypothetical protein
MKVFFGLLLLVNIAFAAFQWLIPYDQMFAESRKIPAGVSLQLLTDANVEAITETEVVAKVEQQAETEPEPLVVEDTSDKRVCYTVGPFKDKTLATEVSGRYSAKKVKTSLKSNLEKEYLGVMVFIGGHKSRDEALRTADDLSSQGIRDHIIINNEDRRNLVSLGVFGLKKNADGLRDKIANKKFKVETEARYRERTIYWLYGEQSSEVELQQLLDDPEFDNGISQIPTQCLPS